jgi:hypothetical protein
MRDTHRMREKYDLSLDSRQVVSLLIGAIVVLGAVFVLGVLVGKKLAGTQHADRGSDLLAALDHRTDALEKARAAPPLTFQEELTRTTPDDKHLAAPAKAPPATKPTPTPPPATATAAKSAPTATAPAEVPPRHQRRAIDRGERPRRAGRGQVPRDGDRRHPRHARCGQAGDSQASRGHRLQRRIHPPAGGQSQPR